MPLEELFKNPPPVLDIDDDLEPAKEPSKKWRNKYRTLVSIVFNYKPSLPGDIVWGERAHPSKELAEQAREEGLKQGRTSTGLPIAELFGDVEWLGAVPVEE